MRLSLGILFAAIFLPSTLMAQQVISPKQMVEHLEKLPIVCVIPTDGSKGCTSIELYSFLTGSKGIALSTGVFPIQRRKYLRMTFSQPFRVSGKGFCVTGAQPIKDAHLEIVRKLNYQGSFTGQELNSRSRDLIQKQLLNPLIALLETSTICTRFLMPKTRSATNEIAYISYLDGEVIEEGRMLLFSSSSASKLKLSPIQY